MVVMLILFIIIITALEKNNFMSQKFKEWDKKVGSDRPVITN